MSLLVIFEGFGKLRTLFAYLGTPFHDFQTWEGFVEAKLSSRDQVGCQRSLPDGLGVAWERQDDGFGWRATASGRSHATPKPSGRLR